MKIWFHNVTKDNEFGFFELSPRSTSFTNANMFFLYTSSENSKLLPNFYIEQVRYLMFTIEVHILLNEANHNKLHKICIYV